MFSLAFLALAVASASAHSISHVHRRHAQVARATPPEGWATGYLEPYDTYHTRYLAIDCEGKHNTTTFDLCCHPMLATETLAKNRNACCVPGATVACPGESSTLSATASKTSSAAAASASAAEEDCDDGDEDDTGDDEDCDAEDDGDNDDDGEECEDESSTITHTSTKAAVTTTPVAVKAEATATSTTEAKPTTTSTTEAKPTTTSTTEAKPTTTSTKAQPTTTTTEAKPTTTTKPTTTAEPATTSTTKKTTPTTPASSSVFTGGFGTWFTQNGVAGACGTVHSDSSFIVALQTEKYANGANCGRTVKITDLNNQKTTTAIVADECPTCTNSNCLDMSEGLFEFFEDLSVGEMSISWEFTD